MAQLVKTVSGLAIASCKTVNGLAIASAKTVMGVDNTSGGGGGNAFTLVGTPATQESTNTITSGAPTEGNLHLIYAACEGISTAFTGCTRGADTYTAGNLSTHANDELSGRFFWFLAASADATTVTTLTFTGTPSFQKIFSWIFSATGTHALDTQAAATTGTGTSVATNTFTSSVDTGLAVAGIGLFGSRDRTVEKIGANNATTILDALGAGSSWDYLFSGGALSGVTANCTLASSIEWVGSALVFKST